MNSTKTIVAKKGVNIKSSDGINISAFTSNYNKISRILTLEKNIIIEDKPNKLSINSEKIVYDKNKEIIFSKDKTEILISDLYILKGADIKLDRNLLKLSSKKKATLKDIYNNILNLDDLSNFFKLKSVICSVNFSFCLNSF